MNIFDALEEKQEIKKERVERYDANSFTYGFEIEWGDIDRTFEIPEHLGAWEFAETDIVNIHEPYKYQACDPLGTEPPMGGEINTKPTKTWPEQVDRIMEIHDLFVKNGNQPSASVVNHGHLHVFVPGLTEDPESLKRLARYVYENQEETISKVYGYYDHPEIKGSKGAKMYLKLDGGRMYPEYMIENIEKNTVDLDSFVKMHAAGKDGVSMGRPFRYGINLYCLKHTGTIEFRCLRSSVNRKEIEDSFRFAEMFIDAALNDGPSVKEILAENDLQFPPFVWNWHEYNGWVNTKWDKERGNKKRTFHEVD